MRYTLAALLMGACTGESSKDADDCPSGDDSSGVVDDSGDDTGSPGTFDPANFANVRGEAINFFQLTPSSAACTLRFTITGTTQVREDCAGCEFSIDVALTFDAQNSTVDTRVCGFAAVDGQGTLAYHPDFDGTGPSFVLPLGDGTALSYASARLQSDAIGLGYSVPPPPPLNLLDVRFDELTPVRAATNLDELFLELLRPEP